VDKEGQGGAVFCAIASLVLSGRLMQLQSDRNDLIRWLMFRQQGGFQGRCNKTPDSCYAFWNGATLELLGKHHLVDVPSCQAFIRSCQFPFGGLCKYPDAPPDVMHSYYSLAWLSIAANQKRKSQFGEATATDEDDPFACLVPVDAKLQVPFFPQPHKKA
jgi:geranylgeranyl transferase type-1 subunit beta